MLPPWHDLVGCSVASERGVQFELRIEKDGTLLLVIGANIETFNGFVDVGRYFCMFFC